MENLRANKWDLRFIHLAEHVSTWSKDPSTKCGAIIISPDKSIVSTGYNGFPRGMSDAQNLYDNREVKYERVIHCEMNAIMSAMGVVQGCILYTWPFLSCPRCAVHMVQAGIIRCVAPRVSPDKLERWATAIARTKGYFEEALVSYTEVDLAKSSVHSEFSAPLGAKEAIADEFRSMAYGGDGE